MDWTTIIVAVFSSGALTAILRFIDKRIDKKDKRDEKQESRDKLLIFLAAEKQVAKMQEFIDKGTISMSDCQYFAEVYSDYKKLGGNHLVDINWKKCQSLRIEPDK
jgi:hypothetical protein